MPALKRSSHISSALTHQWPIVATRLDQEWRLKEDGHGLHFLPRVSHGRDASLSTSPHLAIRGLRAPHPEDENSIQGARLVLCCTSYTCWGMLLNTNTSKKKLDNNIVHHILFHGQMPQNVRKLWQEFHANMLINGLVPQSVQMALHECRKISTGFPASCLVTWSLLYQGKWKLKPEISQFWFAQYHGVPPKQGHQTCFRTIIRNLDRAPQGCCIS